MIWARMPEKSVPAHSSIDLLTFKQFGVFRKSKRGGVRSISLGFKQLARCLHRRTISAPHRLRR
jgi:hypothetical protein